MQKFCNKCQTTKELSEFGKSAPKPDGHHSVCKKCKRDADARYRARPDKKEKLREYSAQTRHKYTQRYDKRKYQATVNACSQRWHEQNPGASDAHKAVRNAVASGKLLAISECECQHCGKTAENYHHHLGYAPENRLDVVPLCFSCHKKEHRKHH